MPNEQLDTIICHYTPLYKIYVATIRHYLCENIYFGIKACGK